jgi:hypothetical protein
VGTSICAVSVLMSAVPSRTIMLALLLVGCSPRIQFVYEPYRCWLEQPTVLLHLEVRSGALTRTRSDKDIPHAPFWHLG